MEHPFYTVIQNSRFKIQNDTTERYSIYLSVVVFFENYGNFENYGSLGNYENCGITV